MCIQISVFGHPDFYVQPPPVRTPRKSPVSRNPRDELHLVAALVRLNMAILIHFIAFILDPELDVLGVACAHPRAAVVRVDPNIGPPGDRVVSGPLRGAGLGHQGYGSKQGSTDYSKPRGGVAASKQIHG